MNRSILNRICSWLDRMMQPSEGVPVIVPFGGLSTIDGNDVAALYYFSSFQMGNSEHVSSDDHPTRILPQLHPVVEDRIVISEEEVKERLWFLSAFNGKRPSRRRFPLLPIQITMAQSRAEMEFLALMGRQYPRIQHIGGGS